MLAVWREKNDGNIFWNAVETNDKFVENLMSFSL